MPRIFSWLMAVTMVVLAVVLSAWLAGCQDKTTNQDITVEIPAHYLHVTNDQAKLQKMCGVVMGHAGGCEIPLTMTTASSPLPIIIQRDVWLLSGKDCVSVHEDFHAAGWSHERMDTEQPWLTSCNFN